MENFKIVTATAEHPATRGLFRMPGPGWVPRSPIHEEHTHPKRQKWANSHRWSQYCSHVGPMRSSAWPLATTLCFLDSFCLFPRREQSLPKSVLPKLMLMLRNPAERSSWAQVPQKSVAWPTAHRTLCKPHTKPQCVEFKACKLKQKGPRFQLNEAPAVQTSLHVLCAWHTWQFVTDPQHQLWINALWSSLLKLVIYRLSLGISLIRT